MLSQSRLKELFHYEPLTGIFTRNKTNKVSGYLHKDGYVQICVDNKLYLAHRLAWLYVYGEFPKEHIDHIDGVKNNNRILNLRDVTHSENQHNQRKAQKHNKTGLLGVSFDKKSMKYRAQIWIAGKSETVGYFSNPEDAHHAYIDAKRKLHKGCTI